VIDLSLNEPLVRILGSGPSLYDQLGIIAGRHGNRSPNNAPDAVAKSLGFFGTSAIHSRQIPVLHEVFAPSAEEIGWAQTGSMPSRPPAGRPAGCPTANFIDLPVADPVRRVLHRPPPDRFRRSGRS
jgi:hypothetical protein